MGRPSSRKSSFGSRSHKSQSSIDAESVVKNERVYLHIYDYEAREYTGLTTYHGMVRIYNSTTWPSRIFWCVVVVSCLSLFMIHSGIMLYSYHLKPTLTQVTVIVPDGGLAFPDVTVCGFFPVVESKLKSWNMSDSVLTYLLEEYGIEPAEKDPVFQKEFISYKENYSMTFNKTFDVREFFEQTGPDCEDLIKLCYFSGEKIENCCSLTKSIMTDYGLGAKVYLHENNQIPQIKSNGISVPPGMTLYGGINVQQISLLPKTNWGRCQPSWDTVLHGEKLLNKSYSALHCEINCKINLFMDYCNCVPVNFAVEENLTICDPEVARSCLNEELLLLNPCNCSVECEKTEYLTQNYVGILLYMKEISFEHHEQQRQVQTADLLSNIAGSMGLFLGMSTITLLEIFIFLFKAIWGTVNTERQKQFVKSVIQQEEEEKNVFLLEDEKTEDEKESLVHSDTEDTFRDQDPENQIHARFRRKSTTTMRNFPRKSLTIVIDKEKKSSIVSLEKRKSFVVFPEVEEFRKSKTPEQPLNLDIPESSKFSHRLSVNIPGRNERRSSTEVFRAARRPSTNLSPATVIRRQSMSPQTGEIHLEVFRRPSTAAGPGLQPVSNPNGRRKSTYSTLLV